jgi:tRNA(Glu) U13 pseudouridine synthase TruD
MQILSQSIVGHFSHLLQSQGNDFGVAGMKDKCGIRRQSFSNDTYWTLAQGQNLYFPNQRAKKRGKI